MERLLQVSADLLEEVGIDGFNTNLLAKRAGVAVRAIYRYFPNKWAILVAMAERVSDLERSWIGDLKHYSRTEDWRSAVYQAIDGYYEAARRHRGYTALRAASQASPALRQIDDRNNLALQYDLAEGLRGAGLELEDARLHALCQVIIESASRVLDIALQSEPENAALLVAELKRMLVNLLQDYVSGR
jgi:AcrR family transcriptional regulator